MDKFIFLDFDGVITTEESMWRIDKNKVDLILEIVLATNAKIVISSSWRCLTLEQTLNTIGDIYCNTLGKYTIGITKRRDGIRGLEIKDWLEENSNKSSIHDKNYIIIDDEPFDMFVYQNDRIVKTDMYKGINRCDVLKAIKLLNE